MTFRRQRRITRRIRPVLLAAAIGLSAAGCEDDIPPPPPEAKRTPPTPPVTDLKHFIRFRADREVMIYDLAFITQPDSVSGRMGVTLLWTKPAIDGASITFGTFHPARTIADLANAEILFTGGPSWYATGSAIVTRFAAYKPRQVTLKITAIADNEVRGTLKGEFFRFNIPAALGAHGVALEAEADFVAALVSR